MEFRVLGDLEVRRDGQAIPVGAHQQRAVLAVLLLHAGELVTSERLMDDLWGERPPATAAKTLQVYISRLRRALTDGAAPSAELIVTRERGYTLQAGTGQIDAHVFAALLEQGRETFAEGDFERAGGLLQEALTLWRGPPLAEFAFDAFARDEIARLNELHVEALETHVACELELGRHAAVVGELERLTAQHPLRERLRAWHMLALYRCGRQSDALAVYRRTRETLVDEVGIEPGPELRELHEQILRHDPVLDATVTDRRVGSGAVIGAPVVSAEPRAHAVAGNGRGHDPPAGDVTSQRARGGVRRRRGAGVIVAAVALVAGVAGAIALLARSVPAPEVTRVPANAVAVIAPVSARVLSWVSVGTRPGPIVAAGGSVWAANLDDNTITRIDAAKPQAAKTITPAGFISGLAGAGTSLWVSDTTTGVVRHIDTTVLAMSRLPPPSGPSTGNQSFDGPQPVAVGAASLWVAQGGDVTRFSADGTRRLASIPVGDELTAIAVGAGATWVSDATNNTVSKIVDDAVTDTITTGDGPDAIAVGDGAVWLANRFDGTVARIDPRSDRVTRLIRVGRAPSGLAVMGGSVWVTNSGDGTLSKIDARSYRVRTLTVGNSPVAVTAAAGRLWISIQAPNAVPPAAARSGGVARVALTGTPPDSMDPALAYDQSSWRILYATCAKLYNYPDASGSAGTRAVPEIARGQPSVSPDRRTYTITIRPGFRFSPPSNAPVTAQTFRHVIERDVAPAWGPPGVIPNPNYFADIVGAATYMRGRAAHISGVSASGDRLSIRLTHADPALALRLTLPFFCAVPDDSPVRHGGIADLPMAGPYYVRSYRAGQQIVLARNPNYRGRRPARPSAIEVTIGGTSTAAIASVIAGTQDYYAPRFQQAGEMSAGQAAELRARYGRPRTHAEPRLFINPSGGLNYLVLNTARPLFAKERLRRAVSFAIDRRSLAATAGYPARPADQYLAPGTPGFRDRPLYPLTGPDLTRARRLAGLGRHHATLVVCNKTPCPQWAAIIRANLAKIGIDVTPVELPVHVMSGRVQDHANWDIGLWNWSPDFPDPSDVLNTLLRHNDTPATYNADIARFDDPAYNRRLDAAAQLTGPPRYAAYAKLDGDLTADAAPMATIAMPLTTDFLSARASCAMYQPVYAGIDLAALCLHRR